MTKPAKKKQKLVKQLAGVPSSQGAGLKMSNKGKSSIKAKSKIVCTCPKEKQM